MTDQTIHDVTDEDRRLAPSLPEGWRLADHRENGRVVVTNTNPDRDGRVYYMLASENRFGYDSLFCYPEDLTYLDDKEAEDVATVKVGTVIESADDPRISALPAWTVLRDPDGRKITKFDDNTDSWRGPGYVPIAGDGTEYGPWTIARLPKEVDQRPPTKPSTTP